MLGPVSVVRRSTDSDLVQGLPQNLILPFPLHQVFDPFRSFITSNLVQELPQSLFFRFPCTNFLALFGAPTLRTWCKNSLKTLFFRFLCTKSPAQDEPPPLLTWCSIPRNPLFLRRGAPRPSARPALWCPRRGASWPANPYSFVGRYHAVCLGPPASHLFNLFIHLSL